MKIDQQGEWLIDCRQIISPNFDERPQNTDISLLVVHAISLPPGEFGSENITRLFTNTLNPKDHPYFRKIHNLCVSSHLLIRRDGEVIQYVPFSKRAWHAGVSSFEGRSTCNDYSIGIELEGTDDLPYEDEQYKSLQQVTHLLMQHYSLINSKRIAGHCDISPGRKTDPGPLFDWQRYLSEL